MVPGPGTAAVVAAVIAVVAGSRHGLGSGEILDKSEPKEVPLPLFDGVLSSLSVVLVDTSIYAWGQLPLPLNDAFPPLMSILNSVRLPGSLVTAIVPSYLSMIALTIGKPSPFPPEW